METLIKELKSDNNTKAPYAYYDWNSNTSTYYVHGFLVATLNHNIDHFEDIIEMTESDKDFYYAEMSKERQQYLNQ